MGNSVTYFETLEYNLSLVLLHPNQSFTKSKLPSPTKGENPLFCSFILKPLIICHLQMYVLMQNINSRKQLKKFYLNTISMFN